MRDVLYGQIRASKSYYIFLLIMSFLILCGGYVTYLMYTHGLGFEHPILGKLSGLSSRVPWGLSIIMAIFYIGLSAGSLVISALSSVFNKTEYKPFSRIGAFMSVILIIAALLSIMLDWGRPDRFINPFIYLNPTSMFSINSFLYSSYIIIGISYLVAMFYGKTKLVSTIGLIAVLWAVLVHSGTGYIFGSVPRELYESPLLAPSFVAAALSSGTALIILVIQLAFNSFSRPYNKEIIFSLSRLLRVFILVVFYFILVENLFRSYIPKSREAEWFFLFGENFHDVLESGNLSMFFSLGEAGSIHHIVFWIGLMLVGTVIPALILYTKRLSKYLTWVNIASIMVVIGVLCERYIIVIPGQTFRPELVPGATVLMEAVDRLANTSLGGIASYNISFAEIVQALGILGFVAFAFVLCLRWFSLLPRETLAIDENNISDNIDADSEEV